MNDDGSTTKSPRTLDVAIDVARGTLATEPQARLRAEAAALVAAVPRVRELATPEAAAAIALYERSEQTPPQSRIIGVGREQELRVEGRLLRADLPAGTVRTVGRDLAASWGELRLVLADECITEHSFGDESRSTIRWFLLPVVEWLIRHWHALLAEPLDDDDVERHVSDPLTAIPIPSLRWSRWVHSLEITPGHRWLHQPSVRFEPSGRSVRLDPSAVARDLRTWCIELAKEVHALSPSVRTETAVAQAVALETFESASIARALAAPLQLGVRRASTELGTRVSSLLQPMVDGPSPLRLAFGSASPRITEADVRRISQMVDAFRDSQPLLGPALHRVRAATPVESAGRPWEQGYDLAFQALESLEVDPTRVVDVRGLLAQLDVPVEHLRLDDPDVRGIVVGYPREQPMVALNDSSPRNLRSEGVRFTLAHELCHLLFDQGNMTAIGMMSGPWAPAGLEQRANAFAAMFLMPPELVRTGLEAIGADASPSRLGRYMRTSTAAVREHLKNLRRRGLIDGDQHVPEVSDDDRRVPDYWRA